jgi:hypothetical protein
MNTIWANQVDAVIVPATACGGSAVLNFSQQSQTQIITVEDNTSHIVVPPTPLGIKSVFAHSYLEVLGVLVAHRAGVAPQALRPELPPLQRLV